ncbi:helix-turn-helix domain-containing protein [Mycobacterium marinum]|uniref:helix-turn-helix domain-containing protein n=1 Tax=Mycobacterium marinum TaxID=1781 RepID=UPI0035664E7E
MRDRYRIEPTPAQQAMLARVFGCAGVRSTMRYGCASRRIGRGWSCPTPWIERHVVTRPRPTPSGPGCARCPVSC